MMRLITSLFILVCVLLVACTSTVINDTAVANQSVSLSVQSLADVQQHCRNLCGNDKTVYCTNEHTVTLTSGKITSGTCRSLSKYVAGFDKCEGFCKTYGKERGCTTSTGGTDPLCRGN